LPDYLWEPVKNRLFLFKRKEGNTMKRSWKKKASVWTMAAAMTVSYIPQYSFAEETTENIKQETQTQTIEEQTILENLTSEALATESIPETSLQIPTESSSESVPETSSQTPSESITPR